MGFAGPRNGLDDLGHGKDFLRCVVRIDGDAHQSADGLLHDIHVADECLHGPNDCTDTSRLHDGIADRPCVGKIRKGGTGLQIHGLIVAVESHSVQDERDGPNLLNCGTVLFQMGHVPQHPEDGFVQGTGLWIHVVCLCRVDDLVQYGRRCRQQLAQIFIRGQAPTQFACKFQGGQLVSQRIHGGHDHIDTGMIAAVNLGLEHAAFVAAGVAG
mmetsp:Transcript_5821/g.17317  ORF Transcript_5821/g.17317 Transcript_5821/m.17317 type:complete len:213 (+) Transcript_5821:1049-1687(+)